MLCSKRRAPGCVRYSLSLWQIIGFYSAYFGRLLFTIAEFLYIAHYGLYWANMKLLTVILVVVLLVLQYRLWVGEGSLGHVARLKEEIRLQQEENARLEAENSVLAAEVSALRNGNAAIEARAREELGLIKEGETFILVIEDEDKKTSKPDSKN